MKDTGQIHWKAIKGLRDPVTSLRDVTCLFNLGSPYLVLLEQAQLLLCHVMKICHVSGIFMGSTLWKGVFDS